MKTLVIVESPAKANTIKKYLGKGYQVKASVGHVKDLPRKKLGVDIEKDFAPEYETIKGKEKILRELRKAAGTVDRIFLAPDPDREGEAIAWHIFEDLKKKNKNIFRVLFNEITKRAVNAAIENPTELDKDKYQAQQARRILDRLVGYKISPILWQKVRRGLSAGRVQSVALRIVVEREAEIKAFKAEEYWSIIANLLANAKPFVARLFQIDGKKVEIKNEKQAKEILSHLTGATFSIRDIKRKERKRNPVPPFITSKLQQDGARKLGFSASRTMRVAQMLYEGVELGKAGTQGLITYMRTDSTRIAPEAMAGVRDYIAKTYGKAYVPASPNVYKSKKSAQEAHEAIRPTSLDFPPDRVKSYVERDMFRLYELIWNRFVASQMTPAILDQTSLNIDAQGSDAPKGKYIFRASGQVIKFKGFLAAYQIDQDEKQKKKDEAEREEETSKDLPAVTENEKCEAKDIVPNQHFTQPPPRFSEASLVKALEDNGLGRPSTYASIMAAIQSREYVEKKENRFFATELGILVTELLVKSFPTVLNIEFTAAMEEKLDHVEEGRVDWVKMLKEFYKPFSQALKVAEKEMRNVKGEEQKTDFTCEKCKSPMIVKWGRRGKFLACSGYPKCKNAKDIIQDADGKITIQKQVTVDVKCDKCESLMVVKSGRFGRFLACSKYPDCKSTKAFTLGIPCPHKECEKGELVEKRSRGGRVFYGCNKYPKCKFASWYAPTKKPCPKCKGLLVTKTTKSAGTTNFCFDKECGYSENE